MYVGICARYFSGHSIHQAGLYTVTLDDVNADIYGTIFVHSTRVQDSYLYDETNCQKSLVTSLYKQSTSVLVYIRQSFVSQMCKWLQMLASMKLKHDELTRPASSLNRLLTALRVRFVKCNCKRDTG